MQLKREKSLPVRNRALMPHQPVSPLSYCTSYKIKD